MVKILKDGNRFSIITDERNAWYFFNALAAEISRIIERGKWDNDIEFQLDCIFNEIPAICRHYENKRGYENTVVIFGYSEPSSGMEVL